MLNTSQPLQSLVHIVATRMDTLHRDMQELKEVQKTMSEAITRLAVIEERQSNTISAQERLFKALDSLEARVDSLEKEAPLQKQASQWVVAAVYGAAGLAVMFVAKTVGLI